MATVTEFQAATTRITFPSARLPRVVSIQDFARGPGQHVDDTPASPNGLAVRISDATGVQGFNFDLQYNPTLLTVNPTFSPLAGWNYLNVPQMISPTSEVLHVSAFRGTPLVGGSNVVIALIDAMVPNLAPYGDSEVLRITNLQVNGNTVPSVGDYAIHKNVYLGDADGSGPAPITNNVYTSFDATLIARNNYNIQLDTGFHNEDWTDPYIIAGVAGTGQITAFDTALVFSKAPPARHS